MAASEATLNLIHEAQAKAMLKRLEDSTKEGGTPLSAAEFQAITTFLAKNEITCKRGADSATSELEKTLAARREKRDARRQASVPLSDAELDAAVPDHGGMH